MAKLKPGTLREPKLKGGCYLMSIRLFDKDDDGVYVLQRQQGLTHYDHASWSDRGSDDDKFDKDYIGVSEGDEAFFLSEKIQAKVHMLRSYWDWNKRKHGYHHHPLNDGEPLDAWIITSAKRGKFVILDQNLRNWFRAPRNADKRRIAEIRQELHDLKIEAGSYLRNIKEIDSNATYYRAKIREFEKEIESNSKTKVSLLERCREIEKKREPLLKMIEEIKGKGKESRDGS